MPSCCRSAAIFPFWWIFSKILFYCEKCDLSRNDFSLSLKPFWRLPIEERACRKTDLGGGDYYLRNSGLPPSLSWCQFISLSIYHVKGMRYLSIYLQVAQSADSSTVHYTSVCYTNFKLSVSLLNLVTENVNFKLTLHSLKTVFVTKRENKNEFKVRKRGLS